MFIMRPECIPDAICLRRKSHSDGLFNLLHRRFPDILVHLVATTIANIDLIFF